ncbi:MAG TPA: transglutaminase family protein [Nocardioides sp.]|nr:transglutaminase family protein [Nocardioides sp.]
MSSSQPFPSLPDRAPYLAADELIDGDAQGVRALAGDLRARHPQDEEFARAAFEWVRDNVAHSFDAGDPRVTLAASEVLRERVGLCYAKSVLVAALLRSEGIPAGLCYQRVGNTEDGFFLHGLVAVHLRSAWHRQDPRGNRPGIDAQFSITGERLAYDIDESTGQRDYPDIYATVAPEVVAALSGASDVLTARLPSDISDADRGTAPADAAAAG